MPDGGAGLVLAPGVPLPGAPAPGARSSIGAASWVGVLAQPASREMTNAARKNLRIDASLLMCCGREQLDYRCRGPHAGSRTSVAGATSRCLTRPSEDTAANI